MRVIKRVWYRISVAIGYLMLVLAAAWTLEIGFQLFGIIIVALGGFFAVSYGKDGLEHG